MRFLPLVVILAACASPITATQAPVAVSPSPVAQVPTSPAPTHAGPPRSITISGSGDILIHPSLWGHAQADGGVAGPTFESVMAGAAPSVKAADYAVCHVEQGFNNAAGPVTEYPNYYTHPVLARAIAKTGFDTCSTASNWTFLKGLEGIGRTNSALAQEAVTSAGARAKRGQDLAVIEEVDGIRVAHLSATDPADSPAVPGAPWAINRATAAEIVEQARGAREAGAEVVVVSLAMGDMGSTTPNDVQRRAVRTIAKSGDVDLVIGHGSHTIQGAEQVDGMWAIWHGNLLSSFFPDQTRMHEGLISHVTLTEQPDGRFSATKARGEIVLSLPQSGRLLTGTPRTCADYPQRWRQAYAATSMAMEAALADGFRLTPPC